MRLGLTVPLDGVPLPAMRGLLPALRRAGVDELWSSEVAGLDGVTPLAQAAAWDDDVALGTAVLPVFTRGPGLLAMTAAAATRGSLKGAVFHSDHGSVYCSKAYTTLCRKLGVTQSMGAVGSSADNAMAESFNATIKREVLQDAASWPDETTCRRQVFRWLVRYNTRRRHSWCAYLSPATYEARRATTLPTAA